MGHDPAIEEAYRRGYQQGAYVAVIAIASAPEKAGYLTELRDWAESQLLKWRLAAIADQSQVPPPSPPE